MKIIRAGFRAFLVVGFLAAPVAASAEVRSKTPRLGLLGVLGVPERRIAAFYDGLRALGYEEGKNLAIEVRRGPSDRLDTLAAELVRLSVDIIVTDSAPPTAAAQRATTTIPIVFAATADPVGAGFVKSLARPSGNITGFSEITPELTGKRLQLLKEALPGLGTIGVLGNPAHSFHHSMVQGVEAAASQMGIKTLMHEARTQVELERAFAAMAHERVQAVFLLPHPFFFTNRRLVADLGLRHRLPIGATSREMAEAVGLMAYAPDYVDQFRRAAIYVDKILKGAKPGDLPVEQPTKFELVINLKTAKALNVSIPPSLLVRADEIIR
ncbi:MAG TPA: ABC transporter substrate-binding protein [Dehalococcoidia bacterium]|jgi:putative ABC transport system substrate-binding protein|nr:ABC transporter substrate-binding protein [Dehalococcoidia bacterium]